MDFLKECPHPEGNESLTPEEQKEEKGLPFKGTID
jgi:hypothetical protein